MPCTRLLARPGAYSILHDKENKNKPGMTLRSPIVYINPRPLNSFPFISPFDFFQPRLQQPKGPPASISSRFMSRRDRGCLQVGSLSRPLPGTAWQPSRAQRKRSLLGPGLQFLDIGLVPARHLFHFLVMGSRFLHDEYSPSASAKTVPPAPWQPWCLPSIASRRRRQERQIVTTSQSHSNSIDSLACPNTSSAEEMRKTYKP
ncbi:hypothetical protein B0I35DRAFT_47430 [Stachybotrys elegans]|uniref:Uncharacterized protein n=1 Tax=Stachybotrys elegans TaxID=80388 RepID=A0A8K0T0P6_9HYPO|nr:hypothetical protein B0I35DRAFT_47430 [Stachybotrys elegans]